MIQFLKWTTNILSVIMLGLVIYIIGAHLIEPKAFDGFGAQPKEIYLAIAMGLMYVGAMIAFWWRAAGGVLSIAAYSAFAYLQGEWMLGWVFYVFLLIGLFNLCLGIYNKKHHI